MYITLKMTINEQETSLDVNLTNRAGRIYRQHFNRDILKDMSDIYKKMHKSILDEIDMTGISVTGKTEQEIYEQILTKVDMTKLMSAQNEKVTFTFDETERCGQIIWAFAKNHDDKIPNYEEWIDSFDYILPVTDIVDALYNAWTTSAQPTIELKN